MPVSKRRAMYAMVMLCFLQRCLLDRTTGLLASLLPSYVPLPACIAQNQSIV